MLSKPTNLPTSPGVYIFKSRNRPIYIGKAVNLKKRVVSYWRQNAADKIKNLVKEADRIKLIETGSEIEALIQEAELIKAHLPKYNILMRDDKNYFYVGFTEENFPKIILTHQPSQAKNLKLKTENYLGPFTNGTALRETLRLLRKLFPYCTCFIPHKRSCLNSQIGRCLNFCCLKNFPASPEQIGLYRRNLKSIKEILSGKKQKVLRMLRREMKEASHVENFEKAARLRDQIFGLENIFEHKSVLAKKLPARKDNWPDTEKFIRNLFQTGRKISRTEGYDISNISGQDAVGSMVVFENGKPVKSQYRKFRVKTVSQISDTDMIKEVLNRRLGHKEWQKPDLMVIDGGKAQLNASLSAVGRLSNTKITSLAKREEKLYLSDKNRPVLLSSLPEPVKLFFQAIRNEAHRFAKKYHHKRREILFRNSIR